MEKREFEQMRKTTPWFRCLTPDHPLMIELVSELGPESYFYLASLLSLANQVGEFDLTPQMLARHCRLNSQKVARIFEKLSRKFQESLKILEDSSEKLEDSGKNLEESSKILPTLGGQNPRGSIKDINTDKTDHTEKKEKGPVFSESDLEIAKFIFEGVKKLDPKAKEPNFPNWAEIVRLMREQDKRTEEEIRALYVWVTNDSFWHDKVLSPAKLRDKFTQLVAASKEKPRGQPKTNVPGVGITPAEQRTSGVLEF